jgi:hypothetical protein
MTVRPFSRSLGRHHVTHPTTTWPTVWGWCLFILLPALHSVAVSPSCFWVHGGLVTGVAPSTVWSCWVAQVYGTSCPCHVVFMPISCSARMYTHAHVLRCPVMTMPCSVHAHVMQCSCIHMPNDSHTLQSFMYPF